MPVFTISHNRWPSSRYANGSQTAPDARTAAIQFLQGRDLHPEVLNGVQWYFDLNENIPIDSNLIHNSDRQLIGGFTIPLGIKEDEYYSSSDDEEAEEYSSASGR